MQIAQAASIPRAVIEHMAEMAVAMSGPHFGADDAERAIMQFGDGIRIDRLGEARPTAAGFIFVGTGEQRLAGHDVDIDARLLVAQQRARARRSVPLCCVTRYCSAVSAATAAAVLR